MCADGEGGDEDFIVIKADTAIDRYYFLLSLIVRVCLKYKSPVYFNVIFGCNSLGQGINIGLEEM